MREVNAETIRDSSAREATRTSISAARPAGTTLGVVPPSITPTLIVVPRRGLQCLQLQNLAGEFDNGASTFLRSHSRMGGPPLHLEPESPDTFAGGFEPTVRQGWLEDQHIRTFRRKLFDQHTRRGAANLLIRGQQYPDWPRHRLPVFLELLDDRQEYRQAGLHVENTWAKSASIFIDPKRHSFERPTRPDRIEVAENQRRHSLPM